MSGPEKPFSCLEYGCGESFTNEDRLAVHAKKHDMELQLGSKADSFVADQTPTPTRFIRNCEEVGLFQDLQNVNPFEETFKRAIESRSAVHNINLDGNLGVINPDDTLHTPHIFPNLSEENGISMYSGNNDSERSLIVRRSSSDESNNHLSVVRCLTSSIEVDLPQVTSSGKEKVNDEIKTIKKAFSSTKVKLMRQESVDLPDEISDEPILDNLMTRDLKTTRIHQCSDMATVNHINPSKMLQIPVISISDSDNTVQNNKITEKKTDFVSQLHPPLLQSKSRQTNNSKPDSKYLSIDSCIKSNYTKLISQKSIEMALANFTNEAQNKLVDLNNISIEDIPESASINRENVKSQEENNIILQDESNLSLSPSRPMLLVQNIVDDKMHNKESNEGNSTNNESEYNIKHSNNSEGAVPVIELNDSVSSIDTKKGYELIVKWPDGKQIYLKELNKQTSQKPTPEYQNTQDKNGKDTLKRKLKDMLAAHTNRVTVSTTATQNNQVINTIPVIVPEKYIIVPQLITEPKIPVISNKINVVPIMSNAQIKNEYQILSKELPNVSNKTQPVIRTVLNGKICEGTNSLLPGMIKRERTVISKNVIGSSGAGKTFSRNPLDGNIDEDPSEIKKRGNRAAVLRYRLRGKQKQKQLLEKNEILEKKNKELAEQLKIAHLEIARLRSKLGINNITYSIQESDSSISETNTNLDN